MTERFAGFDRRDVGGVPVLSAPDERFKNSRVLVQVRRPLDARAAARSLLPALLLHGTEQHPDRPSIARRMEELYGAVVVPGTQKLGESHVLRLVLDAVSGRFLPGRPAQLEDGLDFLGEIAGCPRLVDGAFPAEPFERERRNAADAVKALIDDRGGYALQEAVRLACAGEPMAIPEHGGLAAIEALDARDPEDARQDFLGQGEFVVAACGSFDAGAIDAAIERFLGRLPQRSPQPLPAPVDVPPRPPRRHVEQVELQQSKLVMLLRFPWSADPATWIGRRLFVSMLGGGPHSRLFRELREKRSLAYYASAGADRHKGLVSVQVGLDDAAAGASEAEIVRQVELLQAGSFDDAELATARMQIVNLARGIGDSAMSRCQFAADQWVLGVDRTPDELIDAYLAADRELVVASAVGLWLDFVYRLAPLAAGEGR